MKKIVNLFYIFALFLLCSFSSPYNQVKILEKNDFKTTKMLINANIKETNFYEVLASIGLKPETLKNLSKESLNDYTRAKTIYSINLKLPIEDKTDSFLINPIWQFNQNMTYEGNNGSPDNTHIESLNDEYMELTYVFSDLGQNKLKFSVDATWKKSPFFKMKDTLGCTCMNSTIDDSSRDGYMLYDYYYSYNDTQLNQKNVKKQFTSDNFINAVNGNWYGSVCAFDLPDDIKAHSGQFAGATTMYKNIRIHYEYTGYYNGCISSPYINTTATYCHSRIGIDVNPSVGIDLTSKIPSISFAFNWNINNYEMRTVAFPNTIKLNV